MILSSSILRFLAFASLAVPAASNSIRGSSRESQESDTTLVERDLAGMPNIGLGQIECSENSDSSLTCLFRVVPPTDRSSTLLFNCMNSSPRSFCLSTQLSLVPFQQVPSQGGGQVVIVPNTPPDVSQPGTVVNVNPQEPPQPPPGIPQTPPETTLQPPDPPQTPPGPPVSGNPVVTTPNANPNPVVSTETCPATRPLTGFGCTQSLASGSQRTVCLYDDFRCTCNAQNNPVAWNCYRVMAQEQQPETPAATSPPKKTVPPASATSPPKTNVNVNANTNAGTVATMPPAADSNAGTVATMPPAAEPPRRPPGLFFQSGQILPTITNSPLCPTFIPVGENKSCAISFNIKCTYYTGPPEAPTGARDCVCLKNKEFMCKRTSSLPGISF